MNRGLNRDSVTGALRIFFCLKLALCNTCLNHFMTVRSHYLIGLYLILVEDSVDRRDRCSHLRMCIITCADPEGGGGGGRGSGPSP